MTGGQLTMLSFTLTWFFRPCNKHGEAAMYLLNAFSDFTCTLSVLSFIIVTVFLLVYDLRYTAL